MSYLVDQMPAWLIVGILLVSTVVLVREIKKNKGPFAAVLTLLAVFFIVGIIYAIVNAIPGVPSFVTWAFLISLAILLVSVLIVGFIFAYNYVLEPGRKRKIITIAFCVFMAYLVFLAVGITLHALTK